MSIVSFKNSCWMVALLFSPFEVKGRAEEAMILKSR
jgi:hypothetical protein